MKQRIVLLFFVLAFLASLTVSASAQTEVGSRVYFGSYWQSVSGGKTPIEWIVIDIKTERGSSKALLLSAKGLDACRYNEAEDKITWESSGIRYWLNSEFINDAFNMQEKAAILETMLPNDRSTANPEWYTDGGNTTVDKVFLLSYSELANNDYLRSHTLHKRAIPTQYAANRGVYESRHKENLINGEPTCWWWLRSPGFNAKCGAGVYTTGTVGSRSVTYSEGAVRPAIWVDLSKATF